MALGRTSSIVTAVLLLAATAGVAWQNCQGRRPPVMASSVSASSWLSMPRTEYGWPITMVRVFDTPSDESSSDRFDTAHLVVNVFCWLFIAAVCCLPILIGRFGAARSKLRLAQASQPGKAIKAKDTGDPARSFEEHLADQQAAERSSAGTNDASADG